MLVIFLIACNQQTAPAPTEVPSPTLIIASVMPVPTSTFIFIPITPSPLPTKPILPGITPDSIQIERWNEYEEALAIVFFNGYFKREEVVCEWVMLGRAGLEVYVWAYCSAIYAAGPSAGSIPAVIHLQADGTVESAEIPGSGTTYGKDIRLMFPLDLQEIIFNHSAVPQELEDRLRWRRGHPEEPPLIILNSLAIQPTPAIIPWITPDPIQAERWREYQTALADQLSYLPPENVLCEWELLGRSGNEIYVWAVCGGLGDTRVGLESLTRIDVREDGSVQDAIAPGMGGSSSFSDITILFPPEVLEKYYEGRVHFQELVDRLRWRLRHPDELPLIVLRATPTP